MSGSLLDLLRDTPEEDEAPTRTVTVLDEEPGIKAPKLEVKLAHLDSDDWERIARPYKKITDFGIFWVQRLPGRERDRLLKQFCARTLKGWNGWGRKNLPRVSPRALKNPDAVAQVDEEIAFSDSARDDFAVLMNHDVFVFLHTACTDLNEFGIAAQEGND